MGSNESRKSKIRLLVTVWILFVLLLVGVGAFFFLNRDELASEFTGGGSEQSAKLLDENDEINILVVTYLNALTSCDKNLLQKSTTDPSQFDDMTLVTNTARIVTSFSNIKCYSMKGLTEDTYVVYAVSNISINGVRSKPLDIVRYYVVKGENGYLIDNSSLSKEVYDYIESLKQNSSVSSLYRQVNEDEERCAKEDETFKAFYDRLREE